MNLHATDGNMQPVHIANVRHARGVAPLRVIKSRLLEESDK
jgi:hypothetical protein